MARTSASYIDSNIHLDKSDLSTNEEEACRIDFDKALRVKNPEWIAKARFSKWRGWRSTTREYISFYRENAKEFILPRNYPLTVFPAFLDKKIKGAKTGYDFYPKLREYQQDYFDEYSELVNEDDKVLNASCGTGKTLMAIYLSWIYSVRTIVLVPTHFLADQWAGKIKEYTNATFHIWKSTDKEIPLGRDFYIISFDLFTLREMPANFVNSIGHAILDEAHRTAAQTYIPILNMLPAKKRTALTATFRREDGNHRILAFHFGTVYKMRYEQPKPVVYPVNMKNPFDTVIAKKGKWELLKNFLEEEFSEYGIETKKCFQFTNRPQLKSTLLKKGYSLTKTNAIKNILNQAERQNNAVLFNYLVEEKNRRRKVVAIIEACMQSGRTVLFLSSRKNSLHHYFKVFEDYSPSLIISKSFEKMTDKEKEYLQKECKLIFGINQLAKEGLDVDRIDTVIFDTPIKDTEQAIGRSTRIVPGKKDAVILYLKDENSNCVAIFNGAKKFIKINATLSDEIAWDEVETVL